MANQNNSRSQGRGRLRIVRNHYRDAEASPSIFDTESATLDQEFTDTLRLVFRHANVGPDLIHAFTKTGRFVTAENRERLLPAQMREWKRTLVEYRRRAAADSRVIELCYSLHHERGRSALSVMRRFAASEFGVAVLNALEEDVSSFAIEGAFLNAWLTYVFRRVRVPTSAAERLRRKFGKEMTEILAVLDQICDELPSPTGSAKSAKRIARIETARAAPETWLGRPPASKGEAEWEVTPAFEHLQSAITFCIAAEVPEDVMEAILLRCWLRTRVLNDRLPEIFFETLDQQWDQVHARIQSFMARYSWPSVQ